MSDKASSESLAATVVANRILGIFVEEAKASMSELLRRREDEEDIFDFEKFIDDQIKRIEATNESSRANNGLLKFMSAITSIGRSI